MKKQKWNLHKGFVYRIEWIDTYGEEGWQSESELMDREFEKKLIIYTIGYFIGWGKNYLVVANTYNTNLNNRFKWAGSNYIPIGSILKIKKPG